MSAFWKVLSETLIMLGVDIIKGVRSIEKVLYKYDVISNPCLFVFLLCPKDVNECQNETSPCHANATCTDLEGSHYCTCIPGYSGNGTNCTGMFLLFPFF